MGDLHLYAIGIDEVRDIVGAGTRLREQLLPLARQAFVPPASDNSPESTGLLGKLGPLFRRPVGAAVIDERQPRPEDFERMVAGQWIPPDRLAATWRLFEALVAGRAWGSMRFELDEAFVDQLDFDLTRAGSPSAFGLSSFLHSAARVGLTPMPRLELCYWVNGHASAAAEAYGQTLTRLKEGRNRGSVQAMIEWLDQFTAWCHQADQAGRPAPDLLGFWHQ